MKELANVEALFSEVCAKPFAGSIDSEERKEEGDKEK